MLPPVESRSRSRSGGRRRIPPEQVEDAMLTMEPANDGGMLRGGGGGSGIGGLEKPLEDDRSFIRNDVEELPNSRK